MSAMIPSSSSNDVKQVSESAYEYLLSEILALTSSKQLSSNSSENSHSVPAATLGEQPPNAAQQQDAANLRLEALGYDVGYRYVEKAVTNQFFIGTEPLDVIKFICKEFWEEIFRKKIDKLQTNHKGVFVLSDFKFKWLERYSSDDIASKQAAARMLHFPCGILRGALANLGIASIVNADFNTLPGVTFNIRAKAIQAP